MHHIKRLVQNGSIAFPLPYSDQGCISSCSGLQGWYRSWFNEPPYSAHKAFEIQTLGPPETAIPELQGRPQGARERPLHGPLRSVQTTFCPTCPLPTPRCPSSQAFSTAAPRTSGPLILCWGGCAVHCEMFRSIPSLYPPDASSAPHP